MCGTNAYNPRCRKYTSGGEKEVRKKVILGANMVNIIKSNFQVSLDEEGQDGIADGDKVDEEFSGRGFCPYDPRHNSTSLYTGSKNK